MLTASLTADRSLMPGRSKALNILNNKLSVIPHYLRFGLWSFLASLTAGYQGSTKGHQSLVWRCEPIPGKTSVWIQINPVIQFPQWTSLLKSCPTALTCAHLFVQISHFHSRNIFPHHTLGGQANRNMAEPWNNTQWKLLVFLNWTQLFRHWILLNWNSLTTIQLLFCSQQWAVVLSSCWLRWYCPRTAHLCCQSFNIV